MISKESNRKEKASIRGSATKVVSEDTFVPVDPQLAPQSENSLLQSPSYTDIKIDIKEIF
jgi:hypothetical protein